MSGARPPALQPLRRLWPWLRLLRPRRGSLVLGALLLLLAVASAMGLLALSGWFLTATGVTALLWQLGAAVRFDVFLPGAGIRFFALSRTVARYFERLVQHDVALSALAELRGALYVRFCRLPGPALAGLRDDLLLERITSDVDALDNLLLRVLTPAAVAALLLLLLGSALALLVTPMMALAALLLGLGMLPLCAAALTRGLRPGHRLVGDSQRLRRRLGELLAGLPELTTAGTLPAHRQASARLDQRMAVLRAQRGSAQAGGEALAQLLVQAVAAATLLYGLWLHGEGSIPAAGACLAGLAVLGTGELLAGLPLAFRQLGETVAAVRRLDEAIADGGPRQAAGDGRPAPEGENPATDAISTAASPAPAPQAGHPAANAGPALCLEDLQLRYPGRRRPALAGLCLQLGRGEHVQIRGASGSGKSTLVAALTRLMPSQGRLELLGQPRETVAAAAWRKRIACLPQQSLLLADSIADNLRLAAPDADETALWQALWMAALDETVAALPQGLDTWIGEEGSRLSGGEARRLALARVLLRDAPLVILDEPFRGLDAATTRRIAARLQPWLAGRSLLLLAHEAKSPLPVDRRLALRWQGERSLLRPDPSSP